MKLFFDSISELDDEMASFFKSRNQEYLKEQDFLEYYFVYLQNFQKFLKQEYFFNQNKSFMFVNDLFYFDKKRTQSTGYRAESPNNPKNPLFSIETTLINDKEFCIFPRTHKIIIKAKEPSKRDFIRIHLKQLHTQHEKSFYNSFTLVMFIKKLQQELYPKGLGIEVFFAPNVVYNKNEIDKALVDYNDMLSLVHDVKLNSKNPLLLQQSLVRVKTK